MNPSNRMNNLPQNYSAGDILTAVAAGRVSEMAEYLANNIDVNMQLQETATALHIAARHGYTAMVQLLLNHSGITIDQRGPEGGTALYWAAYEGRTDVVRLLISQGASALSSDSGTSPLAASVLNMHHDTAMYLAQNTMAVSADAYQTFLAIVTLTHVGAMLPASDQQACAAIDRNAISLLFRPDQSISATSSSSILDTAQNLTSALEVELREPMTVERLEEITRLAARIMAEEITRSGREIMRVGVGVGMGGIIIAMSALGTLIGRIGDNTMQRHSDSVHQAVISDVDPLADPVIDDALLTNFAQQHLSHI